MEIKPIKTEVHYQLALKEIEHLMESDVQPDTPEGDRLELLVTLVEAYETKHYPIALPDPIEAIKIRMEDLGLHRQDLVSILGSPGRVAAILNRKRPLTMPMVRRLHAVLHIPLEVLIQPYDMHGLQQERRAQL